MPFMFRQLREDIASVFERDPAARSTWEVLTCYPGLHAIYIHRLAHWFWGHGLKWLGRPTSHIGRWVTGWRNRIAQAWSSWREIPSACQKLAGCLPYVVSPATGKPRCAMCTRI